MQTFAPRYSWLLMVAALSGSFILSGCAVKPEPFTQQELLETNKIDHQNARKDVPPISGPLTLEEAIARALKYNLDHRIKMVEQALAAGQLEAGRYDMLPRLLLDAGYAWRDKDATRLSLDPITGAISSSGNISSSRAHTTVDLGLHWNILDFGIGYYNAKENADRILIASERRRRAMHNLIQNVRTVYWRAAAAEKLRSQVQESIKEAEAALEDSRRISAENIRSPGETLRYQRNLLENLRLLENVDRELGVASIELAGLIGAEPGEKIKLAIPDFEKVTPMAIPVGRMEEIALTQNADLREQHYNARIAVIETRRALLKLVPNLSFTLINRYDNDRYLVENRWNDAGVRVSYNLLNILAAPSRMEVAEIGVDLAKMKRMALQMSLLTQVHLANNQYNDALREYKRAQSIYDVDTRLSYLARSREQSEMGSTLDRIASSVTSILSEVRLYHSMAKVHEASSRIQSTLGLEPQIGSLDEVDLATLTSQIDKSLKSWNTLDLLNAPPAPATDPSAAAVTNEQSGTTTAPVNTTVVTTANLGETP